MNDRVLELLCMEIDDLSRKVVRLLPATEKVILAAGSLRAASHILGSDIQNQAVPSRIPTQAQVSSSESELDNPGNLDIAKVKAEIAARMDNLNGPADHRDLREKWSGPLPAIASSSKPSKLRVVDSAARCANCHEPAGLHPREKSTKSDSEGRAVHVLCGGVRVRCHTIEE